MKGSKVYCQAGLRGDKSTMFCFGSHPYPETCRPRRVQPRDQHPLPWTMRREIYAIARGDPTRHIHDPD
jgi:hypothetical protein